MGGWVCRVGMSDEYVGWVGRVRLPSGSVGWDCRVRLLGGSVKMFNALPYPSFLLGHSLLDTLLHFYKRVFLSVDPFCYPSVSHELKF